MILVKRSLAVTMIILALSIFSFNVVWAQDKAIGFTAGYVFTGEDEVYLDDPIDYWADREASFVFGGQYYMKVSSTFMLGGYGEFESLNTDGEDGSRFGFGLTWIGRYPSDLSSGIGFEFGGTLGFTFASLGDFDAQRGFDFGTLIGPVIQLSPNLQAALHFQAFYGWYGGGDVPEGVMNSMPRVKFQFYYSP